MPSGLCGVAPGVAALIGTMSFVVILLCSAPGRIIYLFYRPSGLAAPVKLREIFASTVSPILIFSTRRMPRKFQNALRDKAILHLSDSNDIDLAGMLRTLRQNYNVRTVACEGGPTLFRALLEAGLVDELNLTIAPYLFGGAAAPTLTGLSKEFLPASVHCSLVNMRVIGDECFLTYRIHRTKRETIDNRAR
jgi:riboflavin biosynthesis pyrimidine reductase